MEKLFSTNLLCADEEGQTVLMPFSGKLQPGHPFFPEMTDNIILSGGFPTLSPETTFALSPALQLSTDLTSLGEGDLKALAEADLARINSINFRSYDIDADLRVCVIASNSEQLETFLDTYGGILEIEPLLYNKNHPDFPAVTEIEIANNNGSCEISFTQRSPVNVDLCTYCGECGAVCPENCISSHLQVDFAKCTFCKECEKVCSTDALDIYGVEEKRMQLPAIVILDGVNLDLPEIGNGIYEEKQVRSYFKTLFSSNIEEVVCHDNSICQYSGRLVIGCNRCVVSCPHGAVSKDEKGIKIDHLSCEECGNCIAVCPTGSMQYARFDDQAWIEYFKVAKVSKGATIIIGAEKELHSFWWHKKGQRYDNILFVEYPNIESLTGLHLLHLFSMGACCVVLLHEDQLPENSPVLHQAEMTNYITTSLFDTGCVAIVKPSECDSFLGSAAHHPLQNFYDDFSYINRRAKLADVLQYLVTASGKTISSTSSLKGLGNIDCDADKCTHCMACLNECSMRALGTDEESLSLTYSAGKCVGCGICIKVCPESALSINKDFIIDEKYFARKTVAQAEPAECKRCGKIFGTRRSLDRVMQILSEREDVNTEHFEYCDNCRVVKLFEAEQ